MRFSSIFPVKVEIWAEKFYKYVLDLNILKLIHFKAHTLLNLKLGIEEKIL